MTHTETEPIISPADNQPPERTRFNCWLPAEMATELRRIVEQEGENMTAIIRKALNLYFQFYSLAQEETPGVRTLDVDIRTVGTNGRKGLVSEKIIF